MDTPKILVKEEAIDIVRRYKEVIAPRFDRNTKVLLFGSYSKGNPHEWSDIDVAVIVPKIADGKWLEWSTSLWHDVKQVSLLIEPVLLEQNEPSPLYRDVMRTGVMV